LLVSAEIDGDAKFGNGTVALVRAGDGVAGNAAAAAEIAGVASAPVDPSLAGAADPLDPVLPDVGAYDCNKV
jgi:hypothetical protein